VNKDDHSTVQTVQNNTDYYSSHIQGYRGKGDAGESAPPPFFIGKERNYGRCAFSVAGPTVWNSIPDFIPDPTISAECFRRLLKTYLFAWY